MARPLRIELAGGLYHVTSRGDRREDIFIDDQDRRRWLQIFGQVCDRFNWACYAYCLMPNHYHVVVETAEANLSKGMRQLNGVYTQRFNRVHDRVGHVFQGRYKAILVERDSYLLELSRYVVLNPVRAGLVRQAQDWPWSSHQAVIGTQDGPEWLQTDWLLARFGTQRRAAIQRYIAFVHSAADASGPWEGLKNQLYLGGERFVARMQARIDLDAALGEVPRIQRRPAAQPLDAYLFRYPDKRQGMVRAYRSGWYTMKEIASVFGVHYSTVSRAIKQAEAPDDD